MKLLHTLLIIFCFAAGFAQSNIEIGQWKAHLPHNLAQHVVQSDDKIIFGTAQAVFSLDKEDLSIEFLSKVEGLTETGIQEMAFDRFNDALIIAYDNSIIDIVSGSEVFPIFDLFNNSNFIDRKINDIFIQNSEWAYFATGFGLVQYNMQSREFGFTLDAGQSINSVDGNEEVLFISGDDGVYRLDYADADFPNAFTSWERLESGLPTGYSSDALVLVDDRIYLAAENLIYRSDNLVDFMPVYDYDADMYNLVFLKAHQNNLLIGLKDNSSGSRVVFLDEIDTPVNEINSCTNRLLDLVIDESGRVFFADEWLNVRYIDAEGACQFRQFEGPFSDETSDFSIKDDIVYAASGGISDNFGDRFGRDGIYILEEGGWNNVNQDNNNFYRDNEVIQFFQIEVHPSQDLLYVGSFWAGLVEQNLETGEQTLFTAANTQNAIFPATGDEQRTRISGLSFDDDENLWVSSYNGARPLSVYTNEQTWHSFDLPGDDRITQVVRDQLGNVWSVISGSSGAVVVFNPGQNIKDPTDDTPGRLFNVNNSEVPSNIVNSIAVDQDGAVWVGTAQGVVVFECGGAVYEDVCTGNRPIVFQDNVGAYLLETENVSAIAVDGANRKWFGTSSGIFVQSPNGEEQIAQYNVDNSPLFDNNIKALAYNPNTGEMFIATNKGMQSLRTTTTGARTTHSSNVYAFPNPVRPEHEGIIAIKGLARDAEVKITDIDGQLVFQTTAQGGQAIWDGRDGSGRELSGGVYLVFSSSSDSFFDPSTAVTKILLVR